MKIITILITLALLSCSVGSKLSEESVAGFYEFIDKDNRRTIELKKDKTFEYSYTDHKQIVKICRGSWKLFNKKMIDLSCSEPVLGECKLLSGYVGLANWEVKVKSKSVIEIGSYKFKKEFN